MSLDLFESVSGVAEAPTSTFRPRVANRLAERAELHGFDTLNELETLELFIGRTRPQGAATLAAMLIGRFGDLQHVLGATLEELTIAADRELAVDLKLLHSTASRILMFPMARRDVISSWSSLTAYLRLNMAGAGREEFRCLFLDKRNHLIADEILGRGTVDNAPVYPREVIRRALELNASALILAHQHPSQSTDPSAADIEITRQVVEAAKALRIAVHDHIIVAGDNIASMKALGHI
jgi:DNA repair protein RadC